MIVCAAISADGSASSRRRGTGLTAVRFSTRTWSRTARHGPGTPIARTDTVPASGSRRRTTYRGSVPFGLPGSSSGSRSSPPAIANSSTTPSDRSAAPSAVTSISCSTASSQAWSGPDPSVVRRWTARNRRMTWTTGWPVCSRTHSAWVKLLSDGSAAAYPGAITTPNCQRLWFFADEARYGYRMYPSYKNSVGDAPDGVEVHGGPVLVHQDCGDQIPAFRPRRKRRSTSPGMSVRCDSFRPSSITKRAPVLPGTKPRQGMSWLRGEASGMPGR